MPLNIPTQRLVLIASSALAAALLLAGCGSSGSSSNSDSVSGASSSSDATVSAANAAVKSPATSLQSIVLQNADLPTGWTGTAYKADPTDAASHAALVACVGGKDTSPDKTDTANSQDYSMGDAQISSSVSSFKAQADLDADVDMLKSSKISGCYETLFKARLMTTLPAGSTVDAISIKVTPGNNGGPNNVAGIADGKINVTVNGTATTIGIGAVFITGPLLEAEVDFTSANGAAVSGDVQGAVVTAVANRAAAAS